MMPTGQWRPSEEQMRTYDETVRKRNEERELRYALAMYIKRHNWGMSSDLAMMMVRDMDTATVKKRIAEIDPRYCAPPPENSGGDALENRGMKKYNIGTQTTQMGHNSTMKNDGPITTQNIYLGTNSDVANKKVKLEIKPDTQLCGEIGMAVVKKFGRMMEWQLPSDDGALRDFYGSIAHFGAFDDLDAFKDTYVKFLAARPLILEARALDNADIDDSINTRFGEIATHFVNLAAAVEELKQKIGKIEAMIKNTMADEK